MNIFAASLSFKTDEHQLRALFERYGEVDSVKIIRDKQTNRSKGYGFIIMPNQDQARAAIKDLNKSEFDGRTIAVQEAEERGRGGSGNRK